MDALIKELRPDIELIKQKEDREKTENKE